MLPPRLRRLPTAPEHLGLSMRPPNRCPHLRAWAFPPKCLCLFTSSREDTTHAGLKRTRIQHALVLTYICQDPISC